MNKINLTQSTVKIKMISNINTAPTLFINCTYYILKVKNLNLILKTTRLLEPAQQLSLQSLDYILSVLLNSLTNKLVSS